MMKKERNIAMVIAKNAHRQLETESRKRKLSPGEYLEMLIEMDYICNNGGEEPEERCGGVGKEPEEGAVSISEKHHSLLRENAEREGLTPEEIAGMIINLSVEMLPERPISKRWFHSVVDIWGARGKNPKDPGSETSR